MKKIFPLEVAGHQPARVIEQIHHDIRKYLKRERRKTLPEGVDFWDFDCRVGADQDQAEPVHVAEIASAINAAPEKSWSAIYIEILAKPGHRMRRENPGSESSGEASPEASEADVDEAGDSDF